MEPVSLPWKSSHLLSARAGTHCASTTTNPQPHQARQVDAPCWRRTTALTAQRLSLERASRTDLRPTNSRWCSTTRVELLRSAVSAFKHSGLQPVPSHFHFCHCLSFFVCFFLFASHSACLSLSISLSLLLFIFFFDFCFSFRFQFLRILFSFFCARSFVTCLILPLKLCTWFHVRSLAFIFPRAFCCSDVTAYRRPLIE